MEELIIELASMVFGAAYAAMLSPDLRGYSMKDKQEALDVLRAEAASKRLTKDQRLWLLNAGY